MLLHASHIFLDIVHLETIVVHAGLHARVARQNRQADDAVADVTAVGILFAGFIEGIAGHTPHAEYCLIKLIDDGMIVRVHGDMADLGEHHGPPCGIICLISRLAGLKLSSRN